MWELTMGWWEEGPEGLGKVRKWMVQEVVAMVVRREGRGGSRQRRGGRADGRGSVQ
jgi:hypothetical protein